MLRAIKIRQYPNKKQELNLNKVLCCYRFVYNQILALKHQEYKENKIAKLQRQLNKKQKGLCECRF